MKISILGTGAMGTGMGVAVLNAGHDLTVYNRTIERTKDLVELGAKAVSSVTEAIAASDIIIFVMVGGQAVINALNDNAVQDLLKGKHIANAATSSLQETMIIKEIIEKSGGDFVEVSMQALPETLRTKESVFFIGCRKDKENFWIENMSSFVGEIVRKGEVGDVSKLQAIDEFGFVLSFFKTAYSVIIAEKYEISPDIYQAAICAAEPMAEYFLPNMVNRNYDETTLGSVEGNLAMITSMIEELKRQGLMTGIFESIQDIYQKAIEMGYANKDASAILEVLLKE